MSNNLVVDPHFSLSAHRDVHPGYLLIDLGEKFEHRQIGLIMKHDAENKRLVEQLNILNTAQTMMMSLRDKKDVGEGELHAAIGDLNREFPGLHFEEFLTTYETYTDQQWERAHESISNKEKLLLSAFNPNYKEIEEAMGDKNKVHEILSAMIKELNELAKQFVRNQNVRN